VDVIIEFTGKTFGHNVDADVSAAMLQRIAGNGIQMNFDGYWVPTVTQGKGIIGALGRNITFSFTQAQMQIFSR
jgi:hypothetical protein